MSLRGRTLPLGIDFGEADVHVALAEVDDEGRAGLVGVATRSRRDDPGDALRDAVAELGTRERRCVFGIGAPDAILRIAAFPPMSRSERRRAARFEAARHIEYPIAEADVSVVELDDRRAALGIARRAAIDVRLGAARRARLRTMAVDDVAFAVQRVYADHDGALDVGEDATRLTVFADPIPTVVRLPIGRVAFVEAIARSLGVDARAAAERLGSIGFAGAGEAVRDALIDAVAEALGRAGSEGGSVRRLVLTGAGARIPLFAEALERGVGLAIREAELAAADSATLPPDVMRAAGPQWSVAFGLALWATAS